MVSCALALEISAWNEHVIFFHIPLIKSRYIGTSNVTGDKEEPCCCVSEKRQTGILASNTNACYTNV